MRKKLSLILLLLVAVCTSQAKTTPAILNSVDTKAMNRWVDSVFATLSPSERIAQIMIMGVQPHDNEGNRATIRRYVQDYKLGGLIYFEGDLKSLVAMNNYAQSLAAVPLMITIDGEWGLGMRMTDVPKFPRNLFLGAINDDKVFYEYGREVARELRRVGVHVDFAPVLDVIDRPKTVVGTRAYGSDPQIVARHGIAFSKGLEDGGVLSVGKHFPGHGSTTADSHKELPTVDKNINELNLVDIAPFKDYINAGLSGMLTAHLNVPALDPSGVPSTMSTKIVNDLLKKKLGFQGLVFTDALEMEGAKAIDGSACVRALLAGNDVLLMPVNVDKEIQAIEQAVAAGKISRKAIDKRCKKMLRFKYALGLNKEQKVKESNVVAEVNAPNLELMRRMLTANSITVLKNNDNILPLKNLQDRNIAVVTMGCENGPKTMFQRRCANYAKTVAIDFKGDVNAVEQRIKAENVNTLILLIKRNDENYRQAALKLSNAATDVVLVALDEPEAMSDYANTMLSDNVKAVVLGFQRNDINEDYAAQTIFGGNAAKGIIPVNINNGNSVAFRAGTGVAFEATRLGYTIPQEVGIKPDMLPRIDSVCRVAIAQKAFPGCQVLVARHGKVICNRAYGNIDFNTGIAVDNETLYGLASVSKATGTLSAVMKLYDQGKFKLDQPASDFIPGLKGTDKQDITFRQLLYHETGLPPSLSMWEMMFDKNTYRGPLITSEPTNTNATKIMDNAYGYTSARLRTDILSRKRTDDFNMPIADDLWASRVTYDSIMNRIYNQPLGQKRYLYSCLNFCLLANAVQNISHMSLDNFDETYFFGPLGAYHTMYRPLDRVSGDHIAYTEVDTYLRRQHIHGYVHDELAAFSGGVQGNAGLFSNANDLAKIFQMWLNGGTYGGQRFLSGETVNTFISDKSPNSHRGLGFDKPVVGNPKVSNTCPEASPEVVGHTGFTGTCFWVDPKTDIIYIFLSNRVCPTRNNPAFTKVSARSNINSIIYQSIVN